ncbi:hypothetical protein [Orientia tsutsugamushi]|uniref:Conjugal transfer protein n=1 Tax=Orientia tsutsugamushi TaxID=784 RepID=A0A2U3R5R1_ORITS|nr:hypothetical protein [Orientia tsutsugamushi]KJV54958.1 conjugative pilus assembly domain protein [Orientia tsutsugamushi str. Kato PP]SPR08569.1 conjugal transfer protein [Orientia tsutsugamushi]
MQYLSILTKKDKLESVIENRYLEATTKINNFNQKLEILENQPKQGLYNNDSNEFSSDINHHILNSPYNNKTKQAPVVVVKSFVNLRRYGSEAKKMLRTMLLAVVLLELPCLLELL